MTEISNNRRPGRRTLILLLAVFFLILLACFEGHLIGLLILPGPRGRFVAGLGYWLGHGLVGAAFLIMLYGYGRLALQPGLKRVAGQALAAFLVAGLSVQVLKHLIGRPRPRLWEMGIKHFGPSLAEGFDSFPSGHTATAFAAALVFSRNYPPATPLFMALASLVAAARITSGSHFPLDVLGGAALGLASGWLVLRWNPRRRSGMESVPR
ncbi:MAG: phosphatase PAP2 family protein [Thermodesulfobacteriota bacterium]